MKRIFVLILIQVVLALAADHFSQVTSKADSILVFENFEGAVFPPDGWTLQTGATGAGFARGTAADSGFDVYEGQYYAVHWDDSGAQDDWLITPALEIPIDGSYTFSFWQSTYWSFYVTLNEVSVSTDMANWTTVYTPPYQPDDIDLELMYDGNWIPAKFSLGDWSGQTVYVGFHYQGDYSNQWFIDNVEVFYDYEGPEILSITGNEALSPVIGAYLNNDMTLTLNLSDNSGVKSVTGHYDIGGMTGDVVFSSSKLVEETWTGKITAQSEVAAGTVSFTLEDIGGIITETETYGIEFVADTEIPAVKYVSGTETFINHPLNLSVTFSDESGISLCKGYYSKDNFATVYEFDLSASKIHEYTYAGTIPAETEQVLNGLVYFEITDTEGNKCTSSQYTVRWNNGNIAVFENFESGTDNWIFTGNWGLEEGIFISDTHSLTESPGGDYSNDEESFATWKNPIDLTGYDDAYMNFWIKYNIEDDFDYMYFEVSNDNGVNWERKKTWTGIESVWTKETISLYNYTGYSQFKFRFVFSSDNEVVADGIYIDDILLNVVIIEPEPPIVIHKGPVLYEAELDENDYSYTSSLEIVDFSNRVDSVWIEYSVDFSETVLSVPALNTHDYVWDFTIPGYGPGVQIDYRICMTDLLLGNLTGSTTYSYISGDHRIYDSGIVSYYKLIENNQAMAVKISTEIYAPTGLVFALIRNYRDIDHVSADMKFHVWSDDGGVPGEDLIEPFTVTPEASLTNTLAFTRIDLRGYRLPMSGDFWIGVSAFEGDVYSLMEDPYEEDTTAYERSYSGTWTGTEWSWTQDSGYNYHFRAIMGAPDGIDEDSNIPAVTELHQNYPNPFNPVTQIRYVLAKTADIKLSVYNVNGQLVAELVNGSRQAGVHTVDLDGSKLNSGVYFYTLETGNTELTKKMLLIK